MVLWQHLPFRPPRATLRDIGSCSGLPREPLMWFEGHLPHLVCTLDEAAGILLAQMLFLKGFMITLNKALFWKKIKHDQINCELLRLHKACLRI